MITLLHILTEKLSLREGEWLSQGHTASKWRSQESKPRRACPSNLSSWPLSAHLPGSQTLCQCLSFLLLL